MCCDLVLGATSVVLWEEEQSPTAALSCRSRAACGEALPSSIQHCQTWNHLCVFQAKGSGLGWQRENWGTVQQTQMSISGVGKFRYLGSLLPGSLHYNALASQNLTPNPATGNKHIQRRSYFIHLMGSIQNITPQFWKAHRAIQYPSLSTKHLRMSRICRQWGHRPADGFAYYSGEVLSLKAVKLCG